MSAVILGVVHHVGDPAWVRQNVHPTPGTDGVLWGVQTTFLSVGFAGLTIAAQLFADAPLAIGASRGRVLRYVRASWFVAVGLAANAVLGLETIWLPSAVGVLIAFGWFVATAILLLVSTTRLAQLFGHPSQLDEVVRSSLVETLSDRLGQVSQRYAGATKGVDDLLVSDSLADTSRLSVSTLRVPVPEIGRVVKAIRPKPVRQAFSALGPPASGRAAADPKQEGDHVSPQVALGAHPGNRTRLGDTAFHVITSKQLDAATTGRVVRLLQSSVEFEPPGAVTLSEETDHEVAQLKDAIATNLRSGALATAERALELLGHVVRGVWMSDPGQSEAASGASARQGYWLFHSISEVEQDVLLSPQAAQLFVSAAMVRALEAPATGSTEYVDECLRSFTRMWSDILRHGGPEFDALPRRIVTCVQNLTAYSYLGLSEPEGLHSRGVWAMVELVKLALDAHRPDAAKVAAEELRGFLDDPEGAGRSDVHAGLLMLSGWLDYLDDSEDGRSPADPELRAMVAPQGSWPELLEARDVVDRGTRFSRWDRWETTSTEPSRAQALELPGFIDRAQVAALAGSSGSLPAAEDRETASDYGRLLGLIPDVPDESRPGETVLKQKLEEEIARWLHR